MSKFKYLSIFLLVFVFVVAAFPGLAFADDFEPSNYWSTTAKADFYSKLKEYHKNNGDNYNMIFYDKTDDTYLLFYNSSITSSAPKVNFTGTDTQRYLTCKVGYTENVYTIGTWAIKYDYHNDTILLPTDNGWAEYSTLTTGPIYNYINDKNAKIGHTANYIAITNSKPQWYTDSLNDFYTTVNGQHSNSNLSNLNVNYNGVLNEIVLLIPIIISVLISFIAIRKGIQYVKGSLIEA